MFVFLAQQSRDIAPPVDYSLVPWWVPYLCALATLALLALIGWWITRRTRKTAPEPSTREKALRQLEEAGEEIEKLSPYRFSILVSDILRRYVTDQFQLPVTRQTSVEFLTALSKLSIFSDDEKVLLNDFLGRCDLIKFARYDATLNDSQQLLEEAMRFVKGGQLEPA